MYVLSAHQLSFTFVKATLYIVLSSGSQKFYSPIAIKGR